MTNEQKRKAVNYYKNTNYIVQEIANLIGISRVALTNFYRQCFRDNTLTPRQPKTALKPATPKGQGKRKYKGVGKGNRNPKPKRFTDEELRKIAIDYYELDMPVSVVLQKYNMGTAQLQRVRNKFRAVYGVKKNAPNKFKEKENA